MDYVISQIEKILKNERERLNLEKQEYRKLKNMGTLVIRNSSERQFFCEKTGKKERGITRDKTKIMLLARKKYLKNIIRQRETACGILNAAVRSLYSSRIREPEFPKTDLPLYLSRYTQAEVDWLRNSGSQNNLAPENLVYTAANGIKVRSKSEKIIADKLTEYGLPFKYEALLECGGIRSYPDFTVLRRDGGQIYWEHFGLMSDDRYAEKAFYKMAAYQKQGLSIHRELIMTFESDIQSPGLIGDIIEKYLL